MDPETLLWTKVAALGQVAGAIATSAAVIVSLWVVLSERAARVTVTAGLRLLLVPGHPEMAEEVINVTVTNIGQRPVRVMSIGWRTGWLRRLGPKWARHQFAIQTNGSRRDSHSPPYILEPGEQKSMLLDLEPFRGDERRSVRTDEMFGRIVPLLGRVPGNIRCAAHVVGSHSAYFAVEKPLAAFLFSGERSDALEKARNRKKEPAAA
ncbi:hypothetical protein [Phenylobacterium zucineum]|uniref:hypothetical protein n=1 Tax=Phenylobacterium zucineum TaxID=284016 RepID=UPI0011D08DA9|nr:hypothetical protein [Phenylobacterium zucineum]